MISVRPNPVRDSHRLLMDTKDPADPVMAEHPAPVAAPSAGAPGASASGVTKKKFAAPPVKSACLAWYVTPSSFRARAASPRPRTRPHLLHARPCPANECPHAALHVVPYGPPPWPGPALSGLVGSDSMRACCLLAVGSRLLTRDPWLTMTAAGLLALGVTVAGRVQLYAPPLLELPVCRPSS